MLLLKVNRLSAVFRDVDGTLADTVMDGHRPAFNTAFQELDLPFVWDEALYNRLLAIPGGLRRVKLHAEHVGCISARTNWTRCVIANASTTWNGSAKGMCISVPE